MSLALLLSIAGLALLDTLSPTVITVTVLVLLTTERHAGRLLACYCLTVAAAYFALGAAIKVGLTAVLDVVSPQVADWGQAAIGAVLFVGSFFITRAPDSHKTRPAPREFTVPAMLGLGLATWAFEAATAVPYFGAIALLSAAHLPAAQWLAVLVGYTLVMVAPALVLWVGWKLVGPRLRPRLERLRHWLVNGSRETLSWIVGIAGFLLAADAASRLLAG